MKSGRFLRAGAAQPAASLARVRLTMARTQQQRREETIARLLDASIDTIIEVGYARASAAVITKRAGVSDGALFRHFPTMGDFMAATAHEVLRRQLESFTKQVAEIPADKPALEEALTILRDITGDPTNTVIHELMVAARTDEKLRDTLRDVMAAVHREDLRRCARHSRVPTASARRTSPALVALLTNAFDGAAMCPACAASARDRGTADPAASFAANLRRWSFGVSAF